MLRLINRNKFDTCSHQSSFSYALRNITLDKVTYINSYIYQLTTPDNFCFNVTLPDIPKPLNM